MKKTKHKKKKKSDSKKLQTKLWELCKQLTRKIHGNSCYTCTQENLKGINWQTGHFLPKGSCGAYLKYDLRNLRPQCMRCNIDLGGNGAVFSRNLIIREGQKYVDDLFEDRNKQLPGKQSYEYYKMLFEKYKLILEEL
jgi:hypothetical protein